MNDNAIMAAYLLWQQTVKRFYSLDYTEQDFSDVTNLEKPGKESKEGLIYWVLPITRYSVAYNFSFLSSLF